MKDPGYRICHLRIPLPEYFQKEWFTDLRLALDVKSPSEITAGATIACPDLCETDGIKYSACQIFVG